MKKRKKLSLFGPVLFPILLILPLTVSANFYIDYQGYENEVLAPEGFRVLTDKKYGVVHQVGEGQPEKGNSFGSAMPLKDAIGMLMPNKWVAYIGENVGTPNVVDWQASNEPWIDVLARVGANYGYRFVVDWDQKVLQISPDKDFTPPNYDNPIAFSDPVSERTIFIYSDNPTSKGRILVDGKWVPVKIKN